MWGPCDYGEHVYHLGWHAHAHGEYDRHVVSRIKETMGLIMIMVIMITMSVIAIIIVVGMFMFMMIMIMIMVML